MSKFIAIEGLDGSGKTTQINLLIKRLEESGVEIKFIHFPRVNKGIFGELIAKFLRGEFGNVKNVHPQLVALLFAEDRKEFASTIKKWLDEGYYVLVDRYVISNIAFQCAKVQDISEKTELKKWINELEYEHNKIPKPDLSIFLDVPFSFTNKSLTENRHGDERGYLNGKDDIHEKDIELQLAVKKEYDNVILFDKTIKRITCYDLNSNMKSVNEIHSLIIEEVNNVINNSCIK
jgi:dTMP kinase